MHTRAANELSRDELTSTALHRDLLRLYPSIEHVRVVTTNFDLLFEHAAEGLFGCGAEVFRAPALPLGRRFQGIIHVHGAVSHPESMVLTDADFGRAYLIEGWARRFLLEVFRNYTVLFVGYGHNDVVMHYLTRALPESEVGRRFALVEEANNLQHWQVLGIHPITFPQSSVQDFSALYDGVSRLADVVRRGVLDWKRELSDLAAKPPPLDDEGAAHIELALKESATLRFFTDNARLPEWLVWLDNRNYLDRLFDHGEISERDQMFARWLAQHYAVRCARELWLLIAKHGMRLHPRFWWELGREVGLGDHHPMDEPTLARWVSLLLATVPTPADKDVLHWLGERCVKVGGIPSLLSLFDALADCRLELKKGFEWPEDEEEDRQPRLHIDLAVTGNHYPLHELWGKGLKSNLGQVAEPLLSLMVRRLEERYTTLRAWGRAGPNGDSDSGGRSAIEPHEQDKYPEALDAVIDAARDSLEWMADNRVDLAGSWSERLIRSEVPLLRRLAVHAMSVRSDISADEKLRWLLDRVETHDGVAHHEIFRAARLAYPQAGTASRTAFIEAVLAYRWPDEDDPNKERKTAHDHFSWLSWLQDADPACPLINEKLGHLRARYPDFEPREHPDLTSWTGSGWVGPASPWSVNELLAKSASEWLPDLLAFQGEEFFGPDRPGLVSTVGETAKKAFQWGLDLAAALAEAGEWKSDLWPGVIRAWSDGDIDETGYRKVLEWLGRKQIHAKHARTVADGLYALVKQGGKPYALGRLPEANRIASELWRRLGRNEEPEDSDDWLGRAINQPAGVLAEFWLDSLSLWMKHQEPRPTALNEEYRQALTTIAQDDSPAGTLGCTVLCSQFAFLLAVDAEWTRTYLVPFFDADKGQKRFKPAWDGFLFWGRLNPAVAEELERAFLKALAHLDTDPVPRREKFFEYCTAFVGFYAVDPLNTWIPALFNHGGLDARRTFTSQVEWLLRSLDAAGQQDWWQRWLRQYWENRLQGVPAPLEHDEIRQMLEWLSNLTPVFPDAVDLAVQMPRVPLQHLSLVYELKDSEVVERYADAVAKLFIYLSNSGSPSYIFYGIEEIVRKLNSATLDPALGNSLKDRLAALGYV
ncbi:MAG: SIR2 family protein [Gammaproteobacteria bacterium]